MYAPEAIVFGRTAYEIVKTAMATLPSSLLEAAITSYLDDYFQSKFMRYVHAQPRDPIRELFTELTDENFIYLGFKHMESTECTDDDRNRLMPFLHEKYKNLKPRSFDFKGLDYNSPAIEDFFKSCAKTLPAPDKNGWHFMTIKHAVVCGYAHLYINEAYRQAYGRDKDPNKSINKSVPMDVDNSECKAGRFAKIMWALRAVYPVFDDHVLRAILTRHHSLALASILKKLGQT